MNEQLRIGDAEREEAARELGEHFALGRITAEEHSERLEQIWAARTAGDLTPAFRDLPRPKAAQPGADRTARVPRPQRGRGFRPPHVPFVFKALVAIVLLWWGVHHLLFLLIGFVVYAVVVRRLVHRRRWSGRPGPWDRGGHFHAGWH